MEMKLPLLVFTAFLASCASAEMFEVNNARSFTVEKYLLDEQRGCRRSDINVNGARAEEFFKRARRVEYREIHDNYDIAPCSASGTLVYSGKKCRWNINAGGTGWISCSDDPESVEHHFACDNCDDLLTYGSSKSQ